MAAFDPLLRHLVAVKLVRNERRNFVNIRIHKKYVPLVHAQTMASGTRMFFFLSLHLEPFINVVSIHPEKGVQRMWDEVDASELLKSVAAFKARHGVHGETYRYDDSKPTTESLATVLRHVKRENGGGSAGASRPRKPFVLGIRIATQMMTTLTPTLRLLLKPGPLREVINSVETLPPSQVFDTITAIEPTLKYFVQRGRAGAYPEVRINCFPVCRIRFIVRVRTAF